MTGKKSPFPSLGRECRCGRIFVVLGTESDGRTLVGCPRFPRSWMNLWDGGSGHEALFYRPGSRVGNVVMWR